MDLVTAFARARSPEQPGPDTPAGPAVRPWPGTSRPLPEAGPGELDLGRLLRLSLAASDGAGRLRPAPSAGALHPVDARLVVGTDCPLPPGSYGYDPLGHRVHRLGPEPDGALPGATVELSVTSQRTVSHYGHRAWPLVLLDTGHAAGALALAGRALGVARTAVRLDGADEDPLAALHFAPPGEARQVPAAQGACGIHAAVGPRRILQTEEAGGVPRPERTLQIVPPEAAHPATGAPTPRELLTRRSAPPPLRGTPPRDALRSVLAAAVEAGAGELAWCAAVGEPQPELVELATDGTLLRLAAGEARPTLAAWAAGQAWIADAGAVLLGYGCPTDAEAPQIRRAHLRAGFAIHVAHVTAGRHGLAGRPIGSWQQADLGAALGSPPGRDWIVHGLALGTTHPEERTS